MQWFLAIFHVFDFLMNLVTFYYMAKLSLCSWKLVLNRWSTERHEIGGHILMKMDLSTAYRYNQNMMEYYTCKQCVLCSCMLMRRREYLCQKMCNSWINNIRILFMIIIWRNQTLYKFREISEFFWSLFRSIAKTSTFRNSKFGNIL